VKTANKPENRGFDGGKKVKGRKKRIVTDVLGNLLVVNDFIIGRCHFLL
jgi:putative transposase